MIVRTEAVVLRAFDYGETSRIVTLLTRQHGVVGTLARGARRPKSRFGSTLQPMSYVQALYYHKPGRGLQTLKETAHLARFDRLATDLGRVTLGLRAVEVVRAVVEEGEAHPLALDLLVQTLAFLNAADGHLANALPWFQLRLASLLGFAPDIDREAVLALDDDGGSLLLDSGAIEPAGGGAFGTAPSAAAAGASRQALRAFAVLARTDLATASRMRLGEPVRREAEGLVDAYLRYHTESGYPERVRHVADQMEAGLAALGPDTSSPEA